MLTSVAFGVGSLYNSWAHEKSCVLDRANVSPLLLTLNIQYTYLTICALHNKLFIDVFLHDDTANAALGAYIKLGVKLNLTSLAFGLSLYYNHITTQISTIAFRIFTAIYP